MEIEFEDSKKNNILTFQKRSMFGCTECGSIDFQIEYTGDNNNHRISSIICSDKTCRTIYEMDPDG
tara:strand:+ start:63 stop:260 length:198 start_codon:yes stop_codon:yes gene_type:complete